MILEGLTSVLLSPSCLLLIALGVFIGIIFGSIPGLSATMAVALFLPLSFGLSPIKGMSLLLGLYNGAISGGLISAILLKIPGTPASVCTVFDGGPMAERGEAGKAIGAGILYSFIGGIVSVLALICISPQLAKFALKFTPVEYASVTLFALTVIASLSGKSLLNGLIAGFIGLIIGCIGITPIDSVSRFNFGNRALNAGISTVSLMIGFFAVSDILRYAFDWSKEQEKPIIKECTITGYGVSLKEFRENLKTMVVSCILGIGIGILPGIGGGTASIVSYSTAQNTSKHPEKFGTGYLEGLVASETANNATTGATLIPMLTLGIPGSTTAAMLMGGLMIHGISPGPLIFEKNGALMYGIFASCIVANVVMLVMERAALPVFTRLLAVPKDILLPVILCLCTVGAFGASNNVFDVQTMFLLGLLGVLFRKAGLPLSPCLIAYILGPTFEENLRRALIMNDGALLPFVTRPISVFFLLCAAASLVITVSRNRRSNS